MQEVYKDMQEVYKDMQGGVQEYAGGVQGYAGVYKDISKGTKGNNALFIGPLTVQRPRPPSALRGQRSASF